MTASLRREIAGLRAKLAARPRRRDRLDGVPFARACGMEPDPWQAQLLESDARQILLNCSRQAGKSTSVSLLALHTALYVPRSLTLLLAPSERQSKELFGKVRDHARELGISEHDLSQDTALEMSIAGGGRVVALPGANDANVRGYSAPNLILVDEAARVPDTLYYAIRPMLATSGGRLVLLSSPFGRRGFFYDEWMSGGAWQRFEVPATMVPRIPPAFLEEERRSLGELWYSQEYCNVFIDPESALFSFDDIAAATAPHVAALEW
jgi:hypothetical protein